MKNSKILIFLAGAALVLIKNKKGSAKKSNGSQTDNGQTEAACAPKDATEGKISGISYRQQMIGGAKPEDNVPVIVYFHSRGSEPSVENAFPAVTVPARVIMPISPRQEDGKAIWFEGRARDQDQDSLAAEMAVVGSDVGKFLDGLARCFPDPPFILTGHSQGGMLTLLMATRRPEMIDATVPLSAWLPVSLWPDVEPIMPPTLAIHGTTDETVPFERSRDMYGALQGKGHPIQFAAVEEQKGHGTGLLPWSDALTKAIEISMEEVG